MSVFWDGGAISGFFFACRNRVCTGVAWFEPLLFRGPVMLVTYYCGFQTSILTTYECDFCDETVHRLGA